MILIDTHIWIWWTNGALDLHPKYHHYIDQNRHAGIGVSAISCWEVAKLVEGERLDLKIPIMEWLNKALAMPGVQLIPIRPEIAVASTQLPGTFHKDPADQIIVATARTLRCSLLTVDAKIVAYPHVKIAP